MKNKTTKKTRKAMKRSTVNPNQIGLIRYVEFEDRVLKKRNGKWNSKSYVIEKGCGIQYENKVYLLDGKKKFVNRSTFRIKKTINENDRAFEKLNQDYIDLFNNLKIKKNNLK